MGTLAALILLASATTVGTAHAVLICGAAGNYFDGVVSAEHFEIFGASAEIEYVKGPILCGNGDLYGSIGPSFSAVWSMVTDLRPTYSGARAGWMQAGWIKAASASPHPAETHEFVQYTNKCKSYGGCGFPPMDPLVTMEGYSKSDSGSEPVRA